mmetsp:Transcript_70641/g.165650  ORF Transcript_70641/g.165650 Transcript_70641/m.165650 type:complete len:167 (+) Transcript_70641:59-559(+)
MSRVVDYAAWSEHVRRLQKREVARLQDLDGIVEKDNPFSSSSRPYFARGLPNSFLNDSSKTRMLLAPTSDPGRWHAWQTTGGQEGAFRRPAASHPKATKAEKGPDPLEQPLPELCKTRQPLAGVDVTTPRLPSCASSRGVETPMAPASARLRQRGHADLNFFCPPL